MPHKFGINALQNSFVLESHGRLWAWTYTFHAFTVRLAWNSCGWAIGTKDERFCYEKPSVVLKKTQRYKHVCMKNNYLQAAFLVKTKTWIHPETLLRIIVKFACRTNLIPSRSISINSTSVVQCYSCLRLLHSNSGQSKGYCSTSSCLQDTVQVCRISADSIVQHLFSSFSKHGKEKKHLKCLLHQTNRLLKRSLWFVVLKSNTID